MGVNNAFAEAIKGVSAIAHIASILSFSTNHREVVPPTVDSLISILESAEKESSVNLLVYTSSIATAVDIDPVASTHEVMQDSWNEKAVDVTYSASPHPEDYWHHVYHAGMARRSKLCDPLSRPES